jgi:FHA domain
MDIFRKLRGLESALARTVDGAAHKITQSVRREPLEIIHAVVDAAEKKIEPAGRGKYVFPFNRIAIYIPVDSTETRARFEAVFELDRTLHERIVERLQAAGCVLTGLSVNTIYVDRGESHWMTPEFNVEFERFTCSSPKAQSNKTQQNLKLTSIQGATEKPVYVFAMSRVNLGRCAEVRDNRNRLIRTNHVAFSESDGALNQTVSRHHAHIDCTASVGEYRVFDDRSAHGTSVLRNGKTIAVPPGPRGVRLQSGDEIALGEARLLVEMPL